MFLWLGEAWALNCNVRPFIPITDWNGTVTNMTINPSGGPPGLPYSTGLTPQAQVVAQFTHPLVGCMEDMIVYLGMSSFASFRNSMITTVVAALTVYIMLVAYKTLFNAFDKSHAAEFGIVALKFSLVCFFVIYGGVEYFMPMFYKSMQQITEMITLTIPGSPDCSTATLGTSRIWVRVDCNIAHAIMGVQAGGGGVQSPWILFAIAGQLFFTGSGVGLVVIIGVMIFFLGAAFATATMTYIMCIIALTLLMVLAPLAIPTILFNSTKSIFDNWFKLVIGYTLMPMILFGYLAFCMQVYQFVIDPPGATPNSVIGLKYIAEDIVNTINDPNYLSHKTVVEGQKRIENPSLNTVVATPADGKNSEVEGWSFIVTDHKFDTTDNNVCMGITNSDAYVQCRIGHLTINLMMLCLMMVITFSFMNNVMAKGGEMVGAGVTATFMENINYYKMAVDMAKNIGKDATAAAVTAGSDLSMKNSASGVLNNASKL